MPKKRVSLKGGTAINLFVRDMPRLSVDIDLTYLPVQPYPESLVAIDAAMGRIATQEKSKITKSTVAGGQPGCRTHLLVRAAGATTKIDVTAVLRGTIYGAEAKSVTEKVEQEFGFAETPVLSFADLYAGKIVVALDRQHPRDFFDTRDLYENEGIDDALRSAFIVYLESHKRPVHELLIARRKDMTLDYKRGFVAMTDETVTLMNDEVQSIPSNAAKRSRTSVSTVSGARPVCLMGRFSHEMLRGWSASTTPRKLVLSGSAVSKG